MANARELFRQKHPKYTYCSSDQTAFSGRIEATALNRHAWKDHSLFCSPLEQLVHGRGRKRTFVENVSSPPSYKKNLPIRPPLSLGSARSENVCCRGQRGKKYFQCFGARLFGKNGCWCVCYRLSNSLQDRYKLRKSYTPGHAACFGWQKKEYKAWMDPSHASFHSFLSRREIYTVIHMN